MTTCLELSKISQNKANSPMSSQESILIQSLFMMRIWDAAGTGFWVFRLQKAAEIFVNC